MSVIWGGVGNGEPMNCKTLGWGLLIAGGALQIAESLAQADAQLNGVNFTETRIGSLVGPIETHLPVSLGLSLILAGAGVLWLLPLVSKG